MPDMNIEKLNKETLRIWYDDMWGKCDASLIPALVKETYLRHDLTGANNAVTPQEYQAIVEQAVATDTVLDFTYSLVAEGDYVASLGRLLFEKAGQWDWVQTFRLSDARLAETWLAGMGGTYDYCYPKPENAWLGNEVPPQGDIPMTPAKELVKKWYDHLAEGSNAAECLAPSVRIHDLLDQDITLGPDKVQGRYRQLMGGEEASKLQLFMIEEDDLVFAVGTWVFEPDGRVWNWNQAFQLEDGRIVRTWLSSIGGTDASIKHGPEALWGPDVLPEGSTRFGTMV